MWMRELWRERHNYGVCGIIYRMVQRTTVVIPDELKRKARRIAAERGISMGEFIREALEKEINKSPRKLRIIGIVSVEGDFGRRSGEEQAVPPPWR